MNFLRKIVDNSVKSVTFIGMPGTGKSYWSNILSSKLNNNLVEIDDIIEESCGENLFQIIEKYGEETLNILEGEVVLNIDWNKSNIISTGGSIIYNEIGMDNLKRDDNLIVHLESDYEILIERTENWTNRGIIFGGMTPEELYISRMILYNEYADITIENNDENLSFWFNNIDRFIS